MCSNDYKEAKLNVVYEKAYSDGLAQQLNVMVLTMFRRCCNMYHENVGVSLQVTQLTQQIQHPVAGTYKKECIEQVRSISQ
ncbi:MAG: GGGtGRT protein [Eubacterium sp.]